MICCYEYYNCYCVSIIIFTTKKVTIHANCYCKRRIFVRFTVHTAYVLLFSFNLSVLVVGSGAGVGRALKFASEVQFQIMRHRDLFEVRPSYLCVFHVICKKTLSNDYKVVLHAGLKLYLIRYCDKGYCWCSFLKQKPSLQYYFVWDSHTTGSDGWRRETTRVFPVTGPKGRLYAVWRKGSVTAEFIIIL